jgi:hypothetical protein
MRPCSQFSSMSAPAGNRFWEARSSHGRKPIFASPDDLWVACSEFFSWIADNPLYEAKPFCYQGEVTIANLPKMRAMTLDGLYIFLDIDRTTWKNYSEREDFISVTSRVEDIIRTQKFTGAAADLLNANIIARDLGLSDKSEFTGKDGEALLAPDSTSRDLARAVLDILREAKLENKDPS